MWEDLKKDFLLFLVLYFLFLFLADALRAEEPDRWYLISETELQSIETLLEKSETDRQNWELQARGLKNEAANLNGLLAAERKQHRALEQSFNRYEKDQLAQISSKNGEIADLKKEAAAEKLEKEKWKGKATARLIIIIAAAAAAALFIAFKACRFFKLI